MILNFSVAIVVGLAVGSCNANPSTVPDNIDALPKVKKIYRPVIPDVSYTRAMEKLKELWVTQYEYLHRVTALAENIKNITGHPIRQLGWICNNTKERMQQQTDILSSLPWENTAKMKEALDDDKIFQQRKSWDAIEKCLNDHYEFEEPDESEKQFRKALDNARDALRQGQEDIKRLVSEADAKTAKS